MTIHIGDRPELLSQLVGQMGQGGTAGNFANYYGSLERPKQSDIAAFRAAAQPSGLQQIREGDGGQPGSFVDGLGASKATAALPEIYTASNTQQTDKAGHNVPIQKGDDDVTKAGDAGSTEGKSKTPDFDEDNQKNSKINALESRIFSLQNQLQIIDNRGGSSATSQSGGDIRSASQSSPERTALASMIQQLQQQLQVLQAS